MMTDLEFQYDKVIQMLHRAGIRPSVQRIAVLTYIGRFRSHPTAEEVYSKISEELPTLSRTTVYNTLHTLVEKKLLRELDIEPEVTRYDLAQLEQHGHFKCLRCGKIIDLNLKKVDLTLPEGAEVDTMDVFMKGICPDCRKIDSGENREADDN